MVLGQFYGVMDGRLFVQTNRVNTGFGPGHNLGAELSHGKTLIFLSNDVLPTGDYITPILEALEEEPDQRLAHVAHALDRHGLPITKSDIGQCRLTVRNGRGCRHTAEVRPCHPILIARRCDRRRRRQIAALLTRSRVGIERAIREDRTANGPISRVNRVEVARCSRSVPVEYVTVGSEGQL